MLQLKCCNSDPILKSKGPHIGAYCSQCGKWLKWLNAEERTTHQQPKEIVYHTDTVDNDVLDEFIDPNEECPF